MAEGYYEEVRARSAAVRCLWRTGGTDPGQWHEPATEYWGLAFTDHRGRVTASLIEPSLQPRLVTWEGGERTWGVELHAHVFWRDVTKDPLGGALHDLPCDGSWFELAGVRFPVPTWEQLDDLVDQLLGQGLLVVVDAVAEALAGEPVWASERTVQRHVRRATGMGRKQVEQVRRARAAYALLQEGVPIAEVAARSGYADQPHLTRSLRVLAGRTPAQILAGD